MNVKFAVTAGALLLFFISCNNHSTLENSDLAKSEAANDYKDKAYNDNYADTVTQISNQVQRQQSDNNNPHVDWNKKIIRNGTMSLEVKDYSKYYRVIKEIVQREGGYIAEENQQQSEYRVENSILIKVPVAQFEETMDLISAGTGNESVQERTISSQDVTTEVVDTKSRIEAKKEVRLRYLELLKQAKSMKDILEVQSEINGIQEQMEMASGRVNYLNHASAYSTINLKFYQLLGAAPPAEKEPSFATNIFSAFLSGWQFIKAIIVGVVSIWPMWFLVFLVWVAYKRWKQTKPKQA